MNGETSVKTWVINPQILQDAMDLDGTPSVVPTVITVTTTTPGTDLCIHGFPEEAHPNAPYSSCSQCQARKDK